MKFIFFSPSHVFSLFILGAMPVLAEVQQCPAVNCDCENIANHVWRAECRQYQAVLRKNCIANEGNPTGYCRLHGPRGRPVALSTQYAPTELVDKEDIGALKEKIDALAWSTRQDILLSAAVQARKEYKKTYYAVKLYEKTQGEIHDMRRQVSDSLIALDRTDDAAQFWRDIIKGVVRGGEVRESKRVEFAQEQKQIAESMWAEQAQTPDSGDDNKRLMRFVAMMRLKTAGNHLERLADVYAQVGDTGNAAQSMQRAAELAELLLKWKIEVAEKPAVVRYYQHQTAARWHSAANYWMKSDASERATFAVNEAQRLLTGAGISSVADL